jgi:hypothetical protein
MRAVNTVFTSHHEDVSDFLGRILDGLHDCSANDPHLLNADDKVASPREQDLKQSLAIEKRMMVESSHEKRLDARPQVRYKLARYDMQL